MNKKKVVLLIVGVVILVGAIFGIASIYRHIEREAEKVTAMEQEREIAEARAKAHYSLGRGDGGSWFWLEYGFSSEADSLQNGNKFGIDAYLYILLKLYEKETGIYLPYETVVDFFTHEFESDGSLRLYNNGKHPEFQAYVEWMWENRNSRDILGSGEDCIVAAFVWDIWILYQEYRMTAQQEENEDFEDIRFFHLSPQMLDALFRAYVDPDYVLDLTSLQQQGY